MDEFLTSDEFKRYYKRQLEEIVNHITVLMRGDKDDLLMMKGALDLACKIIRLPEKVGTKELMSALTHAGFKEFQTNFIRRHLFGDE